MRVQIKPAKAWFTIGVSQNIIEASFKALIDSLEYKLLKKKHPQIFMKNNFGFVLIKPQLGENIGATARALKNFNFKNLNYNTQEMAGLTLKQKLHLLMHLIL